jgi:RHS repeat-associated protein
MKSSLSASICILFLFIGKVNSQNIPVSSNIGSFPTAPIELPTNVPAGIKVNYTREVQFNKPVKTLAEITNARVNTSNAFEKTEYVDGTGKPIQTVIKRHTNVYSGDLVKHYNYDEFGRLKNDLLLFTKTDRTTSSINKFDRNVLTDLQQTYNTNLGYAKEMFLYSKNSFDDSPLRRITKVSNAGWSWVGQNKGVVISERNLTTADEFIFWESSYQAVMGIQGLENNTTPDYIVRKTTDEDGNEIKTIIDNEGKQRMTVSPSGLKTLYLYDPFGRLCLTVPPKALDDVIANNYIFTTPIINNLCFVNEYDTKGNLFSVKKPGIEKTIILYNDKNEAILSQDAVQRLTNTWVFNKYDVLGRLIQTGTCVKQSDGEGGFTFNYTLNNYLYNAQIYSHSEYATSIPDATIYLNYYYDTYDFLPSNAKLGFVSATANATEGYDKSLSNKTEGLLTGTQSLISGSNTRLYTANYYNSRGELIQTNSQNLLVTSSAFPKSATVLAMGYDFKGRLIKSVLSAPGIVIQKRFEFDLYDRITKIQHKIDNAGDYTTIASYFYDDIGRMKTKVLGKMKHSVYYEYNIRNWITGINRQYLGTPNNNNLFFGMQLFYEQGYDKTYLNGRIAGIQWRNKGTKDELRSYGYEYDSEQRLKGADYYQLVGSSWQKNVKDFTTNNLTYDHNGNILTMNQNGYNNTGVLDELTYTYAAGTNRLTEIVEGSTSQSKNPAVHDNLGDFRDDAPGVDYTYDANGNLISDNNRGVTMSNTWFTINKPISVRKSADEQVDYVYDAMGNLLQKKITSKVNGVSQAKILNYIQDVVYEGNIPTLIMHDEGRVRRVANTSGSGTRYQYEYFLKDHIGNVRSVIAETETYYFTNDDSYNNNPGSFLLPFNPVPIKRTPYPPTYCTCPPWNCTTCQPEPRKPEPCPECLTDWPDQNQVPILVLAEDPGDKDEQGEAELFEYIQNLEQLYGEESPVNLTPSIPKSIANGVVFKANANDVIYLGSDISYVSTEDPAVNFPVEEYLQTILGADLSVDGIPASTISYIEGDSLKWDSMEYATYAYNNPDVNNIFLNVAVFDSEMNLVNDLTSSISTLHRESRLGNNKVSVTIPMNGYVYIFTSNRPFNSLAQTSLKMVNWQASVVEEFHYYPFGLTFDVNTALTTQSSNILYNSQNKEQGEFKDVSGNTHGLEWYDFMARSYDPQIGRWMQPDPLMQHGSPYLAMSNNPVSFTDPTGLADLPAVYVYGSKPEWMMSPAEQDGYTNIFDYANAHGQSGGGAPFPITAHELRNWNTTYRPDPTPFSGLGLFDAFGQLLNGGEVAYGSAELGLQAVRRNNGPQVIGRALDMGTQRTAKALKGMLNVVSNEGKAFGKLGYGLQLVSTGSKYMTGQPISIAEKVGFGISSALVAAAWIAAGTAGAPFVAAAAVTYGAFELGSYAITGNTLEENYYGK